MRVDNNNFNMRKDYHYDKSIHLYLENLMKVDNNSVNTRKEDHYDK